MEPWCFFATLYTAATAVTATLGGRRVFELNWAGPSLVEWLSRNPSLGTVAEWVSAFVGLIALTIAFFSARSAWKQWKTQYVFAQWDKTIDFLYANPKYLDPDTNQNYKQAFMGVDARRYELAARRSIAYVDDLYHLKMPGHIESWLKGSIHVFVKPHLAWLQDNKESYSPAFYAAMVAELDKDAE